MVLRESINDRPRQLDRGETSKVANDAAIETFSAEIEAEVQEEIENGVHDHKIRFRHQYVNPPRSIAVSLGWKSGVSLVYLMRRPKT